MAIEKITMAAARKMADLTQKELGERVGVSESTIASWEKCRTEPTVSQWKAVAEACGIHYDDLIFLPSITVKP